MYLNRCDLCKLHDIRGIKICLGRKQCPEISYTKIMSMMSDNKKNQGCNTEEIEEELKRLSSTYGITEIHAGCFLCNYEDKYICTEHNGGCKSLEKCKEIYEKEVRN